MLISVYLKLRFTIWWGFKLLSAAEGLPFAAPLEEVAEEGGGFGSQGSGGVRVGVVEARVGGEVVEGTGGAGLRVGSSVDQAAYAGGVESAGAHGAGFEGGVEGAAGEAPATEHFGGAAEGEEFGVGAWVFRGFAFVVGRGQNLLSSGDHGADGNLAYLGGLSGLFEGVAHHRGVPRSFGAGLAKIRLAGAVRFELLGHDTDDNSAARYGQRR